MSNERKVFLSHKYFSWKQKKNGPENAFLPVNCIPKGKLTLLLIFFTTLCPLITKLICIQCFKSSRSKNISRVRIRGGVKLEFVRNWLDSIQNFQFD